MMSSGKRAMGLELIAPVLLAEVEGFAEAIVGTRNTLNRLDEKLVNRRHYS